MSVEITEGIARKVLETVDCGLVKGIGEPTPGNMCVEAAVCYAMGLPHSDEPDCVSPALRRLKIVLNDSRWSSNEARAKGLRRLALAQLGSAGVLDDREFGRRCAELAIRKAVPFALRMAAKVQKSDTHRLALLACADECEAKPTEANARKASDAAYAANAAANAAAYAANAADAAAYAANAVAADAAAYAANAAADAAAAYAANAAANAAAYAAVAADAAAYAANAAAAAYAAAADAYDEIDSFLSEFAEEVVTILKDMNAPGCRWLPLTETESSRQALAEQEKRR